MPVSWIISKLELTEFNTSGVLCEVCGVKLFLKVWDIMDGQCKFTLSGPNRHASAVTSLQFLENGLVATSSDDGSVKLWDAMKG